MFQQRSRNIARKAQSFAHNLRNFREPAVLLMRSADAKVDGFEKRAFVNGVRERRERIAGD